jgi:hypothetical protein
VAGGDLLAANRHWLEWQIRHTKALNATVDGAKVDPQGLQAAIVSLNEAKPALATAVRQVLWRALVEFLPAFALMSLYLGRIRREFSPTAWWWIGGAIVCLALSGIAQNSLGDKHPVRQFAELLWFAVLVFFYYFWRLIETSPVALRAMCILTMATMIVYNRTKKYLPSEYTEYVQTLPFVAFLFVAVAAGLADRSVEEPTEEEAEEALPTLGANASSWAGSTNGS